MVNGPFSPSSGARIAADLIDFRKHVNGTDFNHTASSITTSPGVGGANNVQTSIDNINTFIASLSDLGTSFVAIPDGYDCYTNPAPNFYFDHTVPSLDLFLNPLFNAINTGSPMPAGYDRLADGGILYIPAGTYYIVDSVDVPPVIIILGEGYGTKIINATSLDVSLSPPQIDAGGTQAPVFRILQDTGRSVNDSAVDSVNLFMFSKATKFINFIIADNFVEPTLLGDVYYKLPQNSTDDAPLILQYQGSNFEMENMYMLGRALVDETDVSEATQYAIGLDTVAPVVGSHLKITNCFIDGFSLPVLFNSTGGVEDYLEISNCKIRAHGWLDGDDTTVSKNCIINMNDSNAKITNNSLFGNHSLLLTIAYVDDTVSGSVPIQSMSKVLIAGNSFTVDKEGAALLTTYPLQYNAAIASTVLTKLAPVVYGNNQGSGFEINTSLTVKTNSVSSSYSVDSTVLDIVIFADTSSSALTITLPPHRNGRKLIIKDVGYNANTNNITLARDGGAGNIGDYTGNRIIATNGAAWTLISDGTNWQII